MPIANALASLAVRDLDAAAVWYGKLLELEASRPMPEVAEWTFPNGGGLQVYAGTERAGHCSATLVVDDIEASVALLDALQVPIGERADNERVKTVMIRDPDGNSIAFAQALDGSLIR